MEREIIQSWNEVRRLAPRYIKPFEEAQQFELEGSCFITKRFHRERRGENPLTSVQKKKLKWRKKREGIVRRIKTLIYIIARQGIPLTPKKINEIKKHAEI